MLSSSLVAVGAAAGGIRTGWECSIGAAGTRRERLPARTVAAASASGSAASAASVTIKIG